MARRRGATGLSGVLVLDKPAGMTSHDVVNRVRRATGEGRVGHAGTLDPMATGLLVVLVGTATRLAPYLTAAQKSYSARIIFGTETDTDDAEGTPTRCACVPDEAGDPFFAAATVSSLVGDHNQVPPDFSAIKRGGQIAHKAARSGEAIALEPRVIRVLDASLTGIHLDPDTCWDADLTVSKGTYIRAIARDLGRALDSAAHLGALRRTRSGSLDLSSAVTLEELEGAGAIADFFVDPFDALGLPAIELGEEDATRVASGVSLPFAVGCNGAAAEAQGDVALRHRGRLMGIYTRSGSTLAAKTVFPDGIRGDARCTQSS
ncbi:MAG: tRNA pseudouridine(55) synthase TruB [Coriobacteriia bacterium]|nr:tRNA pseudouridine(55) synthase TruB [Coriobacteriia bacterium]